MAINAYIDLPSALLILCFMPREGVFTLFYRGLQATLVVASLALVEPSFFLHLFNLGLPPLVMKHRIFPVGSIAVVDVGP